MINVNLIHFVFQTKRPTIFTRSVSLILLDILYVYYEYNCREVDERKNLDETRYINLSISLSLLS
jgi:hypothetical protein